MHEDQAMFLQSATTSVVGFARLVATPLASADGMTFTWLAIGVPLATVASGHDYYGSYTGALIFTDEGSPLQHAVVQCPGFRGHELSQEGICTLFSPDGEQVFVKWQCSPTPPPPGAIAACDGDAEIVGGSGQYRNASARGSFRAVIANRFPDGSLQGYSEFEFSPRVYKFPLTRSPGFQDV